MSRNLGEFEQLILFAVLRLGDEAYGVTVRREIEANTGREVSAGAVYTTLDRLETRGLVSSAFGEPSPERGGKRKKFYRLEQQGAQLLERSWAAVESMAEGQISRLRRMLESGQA
jgi:DNA-binding PadR family transcriptional regulator